MAYHDQAGIGGGGRVDSMFKAAEPRMLRMLMTARQLGAASAMVAGGMRAGTDHVLLIVPALQTKDAVEAGQRRRSQQPTGSV